MRRTLLPNLALLTVAATLYGCGGSPQQPAPAAGGQPAPDKKITLTVWHDKGDEGVKYFDELSQQYQKTHPNVEIKSTSFPTPQWQEKTLAAVSGGNAPDLVFNDGTRILDIQQRTGKFVALDSALAAAEGKESVKDSEQALARFDGKLVIMPVNRTLAGLGVRKSWLAKAGGKFPETLDELIALGKQFQGTDQYGYVMHLGVEPSQFINLFMLGSGHKDVWLNGDPKATFGSGANAGLIARLGALYNSEGIMPKDAINMGFTEMYQVIESGKVGIFRVGNWNTLKWDKLDTLKNDYVVGPYPALEPGNPRQFVELNIRGFAVPENAPNKAAALEFLKYVLSKDAQTSSFNHFGDALATNLNVNASETLKPFMDPGARIQAIDTYFTRYAYYPKLLDAYEKTLQKLYTAPAAQSGAILADGAKQVDALIAQNKK